MNQLLDILHMAEVMLEGLLVGDGKPIMKVYEESQSPVN